jgi:O-antigen/teichoic acid export membrane protein
MFTFAELILLTWVGEGYTLSAYLLRILVLGQVLNLMISAPGNSIIPNIGIPKYLMYEGIIALVINLVISFFLIKHYGILGAAIGNSVAAAISAIYLFLTSIRFFRERKLVFVLKNYSVPLIVCVAISAVTYFLYRIALTLTGGLNSRIIGIAYIILTGVLFALSYSFIIYKSGYLTERDKQNISKLIGYLFFRGKIKST